MADLSLNEINRQHWERQNKMFALQEAAKILVENFKKQIDKLVEEGTDLSQYEFELVSPDAPQEAPDADGDEVDEPKAPAPKKKRR